MDFIVGYIKGATEWVFAGTYKADPPTDPNLTADQAMQAAAEDAVKQAALEHEESDLFGAIPRDQIIEVQVAYRKRVVGIVRTPPSAV
jgi:hypothetical protein